MLGLVREERKLAFSAEKNLRLCRVDAFENPQFTGEPDIQFSDPTHRVGLQALNV